MKCLQPRSRAIDDGEKALRKQSILDAASRLFLAQPGTLPSVINIAQEAGLAKGTVYLYFKTKEEIFICLLATHYETLINQLSELALKDNHAKPEILISGLVEQVIHFTHDHPDFMHLATMANSVLEQNTEVNIVLEFKSMLVDKLSSLAKNLAEKLPAIGENRCKDLLIHTNAMILGLWQMQNLPPEVARAIKERHYEILMPDFAPTLKDAMTLLWQGAMKH
ncbi:TetR family transcriptional regulator [Hahella ganghwensis]|uniref:TetR family transcriptional regulator n=1 Tax=Hahella ganghwensis TaxID=286420 RepID=UPI000378AD47|nr:TetR family transcriptional regulator [Hahella ganghwensis]